MPIVTDSSVILGLAYVDEQADYAQQVLDAIVVQGAIVPTLFWFEVRNALLTGERRGRITTDQTSAFLDDLGQLRFEVDSDPRDRDVLDFARAHQLTVYDASYLELAHRRRAPLATVDRAIIRAAKAIGVVVWNG